MIRKVCILVTCLVLYAVSFSIIDSRLKRNIKLMETTFPVEVQKVVTGYLKQLVAEILFVKTSVFLGGVTSATPEELYEDALANNFEVMTSLYPEFKDPYYFTQSFLAPISLVSAQRAINVLQTGINSYPNDFELRFFHAFDFYRYLNSPLKASGAFAESAEISNAPPMFEHLAAVFAAEGGSIVAGLQMLKTMAAVELNEPTKIRYLLEIEDYEKAISIQKSIQEYKNKYNIPPVLLDDLVPEFFEILPEVSQLFRLVYTPPKVILMRHKRGEK